MKMRIWAPGISASIVRKIAHGKKKEKLKILKLNIVGYKLRSSGSVKSWD